MQNKRSIVPERIFFYALGVGAVVGAGYLSWEYLQGLKNRRENEDSGSSTMPVVISAPTYGGGGGVSTRNDNFPLKRGSAGNRVILLQQGLSNKLGASVMSQYTKIDGDFGPGTENALSAAGYPIIVDEASFMKITGSSGSLSNGSSGIDAQKTANDLYGAAQAGNLNSVMNALKQIKNVADYSAVNNIYKTKGFTVKTIVTDLLVNAFPYNETAKEQIKAEFLRIGLKLNPDGKWSLNGLGGFRDVCALNDCFATTKEGQTVFVRRNTILGEELKSEGGATFFRAIDGTTASVSTKDVKYLK